MKPKLFLYNTLSRKLEEFKPLNPKQIKIYHCGPTVYWTQQIGNMRAMVVHDLIRRSLIHFGYPVKFVRNYTDFGHLTGDNIGDADLGEDRMDKAAKRENLDPRKIADKYIAQFDNDTARLNVIEPHIKTRATDYLSEMIKMVQELLDKGFAYNTPKAIYFDISKFPNYTVLSGHNLEKDQEGAGVGTVSDPHKKNPADFALWFYKTGPHKNALQYWPSPFNSPEVQNGEGFPGWHIECSAMIRATLGTTIDIHLGGVEHVAIHHTNEIAQSESANGTKFVNYWLHNEHLTVDGRKMGKSEGNAYVLDDILEKGFNPMHLRYFFLQAHYRSKQNFTWEALEGAKSAYTNLMTLVLTARSVAEMLWGGPEDFTPELPEDMRAQEKRLETEFDEFLAEDFNIPGALSVLWKVLKSEYHPFIQYFFIRYIDDVLGLNLMKLPTLYSKEFLQDLDQLKAKDALDAIHERNSAKKEKDWLRADQIRESAEKLGFMVVDTPHGTVALKFPGLKAL